MSLNMLIEFGDGFGFTGIEFTEWCTDAGFKETTIIPSPDGHPPASTANNKTHLPDERQPST